MKSNRRYSRSLLLLMIAVPVGPAFAQGSCSYVLSTTALNVPVIGITGFITITTGPTCQWTAISSDTTWLTVTAPSSGTGSGFINYTASRYRNAFQRNATITVANQTVTVQQPSACGDYTPLSDYYLVDASGSFLADPDWVPIYFYENVNCGYPPVTSNASWISVMAGSGYVEVYIPANTGPERAGTITVGSQIIPFYQYAGNLPIPNPPFFTFTLQSNLPVYGNGEVLGGAFFDFLHNGAPDVFFWRFLENQWTFQPVTALQNDGTGLFSDNTAYVFGNPPPMTISSGSSAIADFNNDGLPDLLLADSGPDTYPYPGAQSRLFLQNSSHQLIDQTALLPQEMRITYAVPVADIDGDGWLDILPIGYYSSQSVECTALGFYMNHNGTFVLDTSRFPPNFTNCVQSYGSGAFIDVNHDGFPDLVLGALNPSNLPFPPPSALRDTVMLNDGTGHFNFAPGTPLPPRADGADLVGGFTGGAGWSTGTIAVADLNNDGLPDLVIDCLYLGDAFLQLLLNNGDGTFRDVSYRIPQETFRFSAPLGSISPVDLNGDGYIDLVIGGLLDGRVLINTGNAQFVDVTDELPIPLDLTPFQGFGTASWRDNHVLLVGDIDKDGKPDIVISPRVGADGSVIYVGKNTNQLQTVAGCAFAIDSTGQSFGASGGGGTAINLTAGNSTCHWRANSDVSWITVTSMPFGYGNGSVTYSVTPNPSGQPRTGTLVIGGNLATVTQAGAGCTIMLGASQFALTSSGGPAQVFLTTFPADCSWSAISDSGWLSIPSSAGTGGAYLGFSVAANPSTTSRTAHLTAGSQQVTITQPGVGPTSTGNYVQFHGSSDPDELIVCSNAAGTPCQGTVLAPATNWTVNYYANSSSDFGVLRTQAAAFLTGDNSLGGLQGVGAFPSLLAAGAHSGFRDTFTFGGGSGTGTATLTFGLTGSISSSPGQSAAAELAYVPIVAGQLDYGSQTAYPVVNGSAAISLPFTFGSPADFEIDFYALAQISSWVAGASASVDYSHTASLTAISVVNSLGIAVPEFTIQSGSGTSYSTTGAALSVPVLSVATTHSGNFAQGQQNATYTISVSDEPVAAITSGAITVTESLPSGLSLVSMAGNGWTCTGNSCKSTAALNPRASASPINVSVNVSTSAPARVMNSVTVAGGGSAPASAIDPTAISSLGACEVSSPGTIGITDIQTLINQALGLTSALNDLNQDGALNVVDVQIVADAFLGLGCSGS
jgi:hypothetical protein